MGIQFGIEKTHLDVDEMYKYDFNWSTGPRLLAVLGYQFDHSVGYGEADAAEFLERCKAAVQTSPYSLTEALIQGTMYVGQNGLAEPEDNSAMTWKKYVERRVNWLVELATAAKVLCRKVTWY